MGLAQLRAASSSRSTSPRTSSRGATVPNADPYLLPMAGLLTAVGLTEIYRLGPDDAFRQGLWIVIGVALFALDAARPAPRLPRARVLQVPVRDRRDRAALPAARCPGLGTTVNGARLWVHVGPLQFQPGELAKIFLIVFLAAYLREKREVLAQGRLKDFGPLLADLGRARCSCSSRRTTSARRSSTSGSSSRCSTSRPRGSRSSRSGSCLFVAGGVVRLRDRSRTSTSASRSGCTRGRRTKVFCPQTGGLALRQDCESYQLVKSLYSIANGGFARHRARQGHVHDARRQAADPVREHRLHLLGARAGARADRRRRAAARLHALRRARDEDRAPGRRRLLEAARRRAHVRLRAADVHHRRRRAAADPADRDHAAVRLLRRLVRRRELRAARGAAPRLQPRELDAR